MIEKTFSIGSIIPIYSRQLSMIKDPSEGNYVTDHSTKLDVVIGPSETLPAVGDQYHVMNGNRSATGTVYQIEAFSDTENWQGYFKIRLRAVEYGCQKAIPPASIPPVKMHSLTPQPSHRGGRASKMVSL